MDRLYIEALVMGLCIGLVAMMLNGMLNDDSWRVRIAALLVVGGGLCVIQYAITRVGRP